MTEGRVPTLEQLYEFIPTHLRHHFRVDTVNDDAQAKEEVRCARRTRSAHLIADLAATSEAASLSGSSIDATPQIYSLAIERSITARMTFQRTLLRLEEYFYQLRQKVDELEHIQPVIVPDWISDTSVKLPTLLQTQRQIVNAVQACLNESDIYLGMHERIPLHSATISSDPLVRFVACSSKSSMLHQVISCPSSNSVHPQSDPAEHDEKDSSSSQQPHHTITAEAMSSLQPIVVDDIAEALQVHRFTPTTVTGPFACFPLLSGSQDQQQQQMTAIGVLSLDSCRKAGRLQPEAMTSDELYHFLVRMHVKDAALELRKFKLTGYQFISLTDHDLQHKPAFRNLKIASRKKLIELIRALKRGQMLHLSTTPQYFHDDPDAMSFLQNVSVSSGAFLDSYRRVHWHRELTKVTQNQSCTIFDLYETLLRGITQSLSFIDRVTIWKIESNAAICVMASTQVPDDRLAPFLHWNERQMKRVVLYKENVARDGALVEGNIVKINLKPETRQRKSASGASTSISLCERADYTIAWADRTFQSVSWQQLRQLLPIRKMNAKHFQLRRLLEQLQHGNLSSTGATSPCTPATMKLTTPNALILLLQEVQRRPIGVQYVLEVDWSDQFEVPDVSISFLKRAVAITNQNIVCVRGRETRGLHRQLSAVKITQKYQSLSLTPSADALRGLNDVISDIFHEILDNLPGVEFQIAELQPGGSQLKYTFASDGSGLVNKVLHRGQGVSFTCLDRQSPIIVDKNSPLYQRLRRFGTPGVSLLHDKTNPDDTELPYVFVPLLYEDCAVGVFSVNRFTAVPKGRKDEDHPEAGIVEYLQSLAKSLARIIYLKRRSHTLHQLYRLAEEPIRSPQQLFFHACRVLRDVIVGTWKVQVIEIDFERGKSTLVYDFMEAERAKEHTRDFDLVIPLSLRINELLIDTIMAHFHLTRGEVNEIRNLIQEQAQARNDMMSQYRNMMVMDSSTGVMTASERKRIEEMYIRDKYFFLKLFGKGASIPKSAEGSNFKKSFVDGRLSNENYVKHALSVFVVSKTFFYCSVGSLALPASNVFVTAISLPQYHSSCEQLYVDQVTQVFSKLLNDLQLRVERSQERVATLQQFKSICEQILEKTLTKLASAATSSSIMKAWQSRQPHPFEPIEELDIEGNTQLQQHAIELIEAVLHGPNVYIALLEPSLRVLRYTSASKTSVMKGKKLRHGVGVSFDALEMQNAVVITGDETNDVETSTPVQQRLKRVRFYTKEPEKQKWPFIVVPIGRIGVLAIDNMEKYERLAGERQPEIGAVDFLRQMATEFAHVIEKTRQHTVMHRRMLREEALTRVLTACENLKTPTSSVYLQHIVLQQIENALNGVDAYIGMVQPLCDKIVFTSASSHSQMENQVVNTIDSVSFKVFVTQRPLVIHQLQHYRRNNDRNCDNEPKLKFFKSLTDVSGPFVCIPIPFVGILSVDTFPGAAGGIYSPQFPEHGVVDWLAHMANHLGDHIRTRNAIATKKLLPTLFHGNKTTFEKLFHAILEQISINIPCAEELQVLAYKHDSWDDAQSSPHAVLTRSNITKEAYTSPTVSIQDWAERIKLYVRQQQDDREPVSDETNDKLCCSALHDAPEILIVRCADTRDVEDNNGALCVTTIVIRRVHGVTWSYDIEFLQSILPLINDLIRQINVRVEGIVARRMTLLELDRISHKIEQNPSAKDAVESLPMVLCGSLDMIANALSPIETCDVYIGEQQVGGEELRFICASNHSLMQGVSVDLLVPENRTMVTIQSLEHQQTTIVHLLDGMNGKTLRSLSTKKVQRVFLVIPMGDNHILCADSMGMEAFDQKTKRLETDVVAFFGMCAHKLQDLILSTHYRYSYVQLISLKTQRHANFRYFFAAVLEILRRDLVELHSQQILSLGKDFTCDFHVEAWQGSPTRRPIMTLPEHFCYVNDCEKDLIQQKVHFERYLTLPMPNLPRTLDDSRSCSQPVEGVEKRGAFACPCMATMLDSGMTKVSPRVALCVFGHDAKHYSRTRSEISTVVSFTRQQHQYFFAFAAVAADVFTHVYRSSVLYSFSVELLIYVKERFNVKDGGLVVSIERDHSGVSGADDLKEKRPTADEITPIVLFAAQEGKYRQNFMLQGKLRTKMEQFYRSNAPFAIYVIKKPQQVPSSVPLTTVDAALNNETKRKTTEILVKAKKDPSPVSFFKRPAFMQPRKKKQPLITSKFKADLDQTAPSQPLLLQQTSEQCLSCHVLIRALDYQHRTEILAFDITRTSREAIKVLELHLQQLQTEANSQVRTFVTNSPRGDEHMSDTVSGGFYLSSMLAKARNDFLQRVLFLETDMRRYLTGVHPTSREDFGVPAAGTSNILRPLPLPHIRGTATGVDAPVFSDENPIFFDAGLAITRVAMTLCGVKKEALSQMEKTQLLADCLRMNIKQKLLVLDPTDKSQWSVIMRARTCLQVHAKVLERLPFPSNSSTPSAAAQASIYSIWALAVTLVSIVKYLKHLDDEESKKTRALAKKAIVLQCHYRCASAKKTLRRLRREYAAALTIQCAFRQYLARRRALFMKWTRSAIKVQRAFRLKLMRRKGGRQQQRLRAELHAITNKYGALAHSVSGEVDSVDAEQWRVGMDTFDSFRAYIESKVGKEQLRHEENIMMNRHAELAKEREHLPAETRMLEEWRDLFELLDIIGTGELNRETMREMMARLHIPLESDECDDVLSMMDSDHSGAISFEEFTRWFAHEFPVLKKRSKDCGVVSKRDWQWIIHSSAESALRKRWQAMRLGRQTLNTGNKEESGTAARKEI